MSSDSHGLYIGIERSGSEVFLVLIAVGKLTHQDYQNITPILDSALESVKDPTINALIDLRESQGWEAKAAWDDFKLGLKHGNEFVRIAICGNKKWQETAAKVGAWFVSGELQFFEDRADAVSWLSQ